MHTLILSVRDPEHLNGRPDTVAAKLEGCLNHWKEALVVRDQTMGEDVPPFTPCITILSN
jgi:hypothetical protein